MLIPRKLKHRKQSRGKMRGIASSANSLAFGDYGLKSLSCGWISSRQIEAARRAAVHTIQRKGKFWIRIFPDKPITSKPVETGMGGGKGALDHFVAVVKPGQIVFEVAGIPANLAKSALKAAADKLSLKTRFIIKEENV